MVDFRFFADRNFLGAVVVALIVSFSMLGVFFFLALYMQNILRYSPLEAGVRFLPSTLMIVGVAPVAGRLADRIGPRWLIAAGLLIVAASLYSFTGIAVDSSYLDLLPGFMLLGIGIALTMSPMTSAAMNAVAVEKAGHRLRRALDVPHGRRQPRRRRHRRDLPGRRRGSSFETATPQQFVDGAQRRDERLAAVALIGAVIAAAAIRAKPKAISAEAAEAAVNPGGSELAAQEAELAAAKS